MAMVVLMVQTGDQVSQGNERPVHLPAQVPDCVQSHVDLAFQVFRIKQLAADELLVHGGRQAILHIRLAVAPVTAVHDAFEWVGAGLDPRLGR
jgi:hypothetical protein